MESFGSDLGDQTVYRWVQGSIQEAGNATLVARRYESSRNIFYPRMRGATCVFSGTLVLG